MMTKKDFIALADALRPVLTVEHVGADGARTLGPSKIVDALAGFCRGQNPQFDEKRWREYLTTGKATTPAQRMGDGLKLARLIVDQFGEAVEKDEDINGGDAVDFIAGTLYPEALALVQDADNTKEGR